MNQRDDQDLAQRIRKRAYDIWEQEGRPDGRAEAHWDMAAELVAIEDNQGLATRPVQPAAETGPTGEPVEPLGPAESMGDVPTMTDQGEERTLPQDQESPATSPIDTDVEAARANAGRATPRASAPAGSRGEGVRSRKLQAGRPMNSALNG